MYVCMYYVCMIKELFYVISDHLRLNLFVFMEKMYSFILMIYDHNIIVHTSYIHSDY